MDPHYSLEDSLGLRTLKLGSGRTGKAHRLDIWLGSQPPNYLRVYGLRGPEDLGVCGPKAIPWG